MVTSLIRLGMLAALIAAGPCAAATFDYHGTLNDGGRPADGDYDLQLTLYATAQGGKVIAGPLTLYAVPVHGGGFSTRVDFGAMADVADAWLAVSVREAGHGEFAALPGRSAVAATTTSVCPGAWTLFGNAGTTPATPAAPASGNYLGTADAQPLVIEVDGKVAGRIVPTTDINYHDSPNIVLGSSGNSVTAGAAGATVSGGGSSSALCGNSNNEPCVNSAGGFGTVGGGRFNSAGGNSVVGGGASNKANGPASVVGGGGSNTAGGSNSVVGGGISNSAGGIYSVVGGGYQNHANGDDSLVGGGGANTAAGWYSTASGGFDNAAGGDYSFAAGRKATVRDQATIGGNCSPAGCGDYGTFVWADSENNNFTSTGPNQFLVRASGGVAINGVPNHPLVEFSVIGNGIGFPDYANVFVGQASQPSGVLISAGGAAQGSNNAAFYLDQYDGSNQYRLLTLSTDGFTGINHATPDFLHVFVVGTQGNDGNGAYLTPGGEWTNGSSRSFKEEFAPIDAVDILAKVLALPVQTWFYRTDHREGRHLGPVAEDFAASFGLGNDDRYIGTADESGVALAAIQGLNEKQQSDSAALRRENAELRSRLDEVLVRLAKLEARGP